MLIGRCLLVFILILSTLIVSASKRTKSSDSSTRLAHPVTKNDLADYHSVECPEICDPDQCVEENCTKSVLDPCNCCMVCLRNENDTCGGRMSLHGLCHDDFLCYRTNQSVPNDRDAIGICVKACVKLQCLSIERKNRTICECAHRRVPCDKKLDPNENKHCGGYPMAEKSLLKTKDVTELLINCSAIDCKNESKKSSICPSDSQWIVDETIPLERGDLSSICCESRGHCACSPCPKTICGENSIMQIYRTGDPTKPGQCCDQYNCLTNSKQCHHDKKIYNENETWSIDQCTTCTCHGGLADCTMMQCPTYSHCGYMYKPENECCPKCGGCLNDRFHVQHMNSTWMEANGCMRCWCENGRSRCIAEGCIVPPCENPRQIANVCCPVCDIEEHTDSEIDTIVNSRTQPSNDQCPELQNCQLTCEHGLAKDEQGCLQCACSTISCPAPLCTLKFDSSSKQYCSCASPSDRQCASFNCDKHCPYNYSTDPTTGCPICACNPCPPLICTKNCTYGLKRNEIGCPLCVCESKLTSTTDLILPSWPKQCQSGTFSYSNGEIWFDGCRQCLCYKGQSLCALISCPTPKCSQPVFLPNRCCPSCPDSSLLPEPIPSSQVCYASRYVTGEELEFDKCTKCICLHNTAFCSISICPPLSCSSPIYDGTLCCPICPPTSEIALPDDRNTMDEEMCMLENGMIKHAGEVWKQDECRSCSCSRDGSGQVECFSQTCDQQLPCANPVLKKGQCCPFCLPSTAAVAVCIFNYVQYRSGEHWNVSECHHCKCILGAIVCHQHKCPLLSCVHTVTLPGHCCPICREQLSFVSDQNPVVVPTPIAGFGLSVLIIFSILICILLFVILILLFFLLRARHRTTSSSSHLSHQDNLSPQLSQHSALIHSKSSHLYPYRYDFTLLSNDIRHIQPILSSSSNLPLTSLDHHSTHSIIGTNTTGTSSSNQELEPITWTDDDTLMLHSSISSNDADDEHDMMGHDHEDSHPQIQMMAGTSTIIYV